MLFSLQSPYLFTIGLSRYLELAVGAGHIPVQYPMSGNRFPNWLSGIPLPDYHRLWYAVPGNFRSTSV